MNRPKREDYYDVVAFNVKTGDKHKMFTCSGNAIKYMNDLECYCDELENTIDKSSSYTIELKSSDCRCYGCSLENHCFSGRCFWQVWREWLMKDD